MCVKVMWIQQECSMFDDIKRPIYQNIKETKTLNFNQRVIKFFSFHVRLTIRVL